MSRASADRDPFFGLLEGVFLSFSNAIVEGHRSGDSPTPSMTMVERAAALHVLQLLVCLLAARTGRIGREAFRSPQALPEIRARTGLPIPTDPDGPSRSRLPASVWRWAIRMLDDRALRRGPALVGDAYQTLLEWHLTPDPRGGLRVTRERSARKAGGVWFTPPTLVRRIVQATLDPWLREGIHPLEIRIVDPAMGAGHFLLAATDLLAKALLARRRGTSSPAIEPDLPAARCEVAAACIHGVDIDPMVAQIARAALWLHAAPDPALPDLLDRRLVVGDALIGSSWTEPASWHASMQGPQTWLGQLVASRRWTPLHWPAAFPHVADGFHAVVGNPPWDRLRPEKRSFYARHALRCGEDLSCTQGPSLDRAIARVEASVPGLHAAWEAHERHTSALAAYLRHSGAYPAQRAAVDGRRAGGDPDLFRFFVERAWQVARAGGRIGLVVPGALWQAEGCTGLRRLLLYNATIEELCVFENRARWAFDIDSRFKFSVFVATKRPAPPGHEIAAGFMLPDSSTWDRRQSFVRLSVHTISKISPGTLALPDFRSPRDTALTIRLHHSFPPIADPSAGWRFTFRRELDITTDARWFRQADWMRRRGFVRVPASVGQHRGITAEDHWRSADEACYRASSYLERRRQVGGREVVEFVHPDDQAAFGAEAPLIAPSADYVPLYEARMIHHFDHAQKGWVSGEGPRARWQSLPASDKRLQPRVFVAPVQTCTPAPRRIAFGAVASSTNERTCLAALLPDGCLAGNSTPTLACPDWEHAAVLLCILCSFVFDYLVRCRITSNLNWTHLSRIPAPPFDAFSLQQRAVLVQGAMRLSCTTPGLAAAWNDVFPYDPWSPASAERDPWRRARIRAEIDSIVASAYGLSAADYGWILATFPLLDRAQPPLDQDQFVSRQPPRAAPRSFITRDFALLVHLQRCGLPIPTDLAAWYEHDVGLPPTSPLCSFRVGSARDLRERVERARSLGAIPYSPPANG